MLETRNPKGERITIKICLTRDCCYLFKINSVLPMLPAWETPTFWKRQFYKYSWRYFFARQLFVFKNSLIPPEKSMLTSYFCRQLMKANVCVNSFPRQPALAIYQRIRRWGHHIYGFFSSNIWSGFGSWRTCWIQNEPLWWGLTGSIIC